MPSSVEPETGVDDAGVEVLGGMEDKPLEEDAAGEDHHARIGEPLDAAVFDLRPVKDVKGNLHRVKARIGDFSIIVVRVGGDGRKAVRGVLRAICR